MAPLLRGLITAPQTANKIISLTVFFIRRNLYKPLGLGRFVSRETCVQFSERRESIQLFVIPITGEDFLHIEICF